MKAFPYSLYNDLKDWLLYKLTSIDSWNKIQRRFLKKVFLAWRTFAILKEINAIKQLQGGVYLNTWRFSLNCVPLVQTTRLVNNC